MTHPLVARYRDAAGLEHRMRRERTASGFWRVLDVAATGTSLVEELTGHDDPRFVRRHRPVLRQLNAFPISSMTDK
jgi:hypothetical protein